MSKTKLSAIFGFLFIVILSIGFVQARGDVCQELKDQQLKYLESQIQLEEDIQALLLISTQDLDTVYSQLMRFLGKSLGDYSSEMRRVQFLANLLDEKAELSYNQADFDDERAYAWVEKYAECGWGPKIEKLETWQLINYENLETVATFLGGYATIMRRWPGQWDDMQRSGVKIDEESFAQLEELRNGLEESVELMSDTFEYTKEAFEEARP